MTRSVKSLVGSKFGRLTVIGRDERDGFDSGLGAFWLCQCECGQAVTVRAGNLTSGNTKSCGCLKEMKKNSDYERTRPRAGDTKLSWETAIDRCYNTKSHNYENYGGRGIKVCDRWCESYENFYADMGERPLGTTLDRYPNNNGNYEPENCRWATPKQQANNRRDTLILEAFGKKQTFREWCAEYKMAGSTLTTRLKMGWNVEKALTYEKYESLKTQEMKDKFYRNRKSNVYYEIDGERKTLVEWAEQYGLPPATVSARVRKRGMTPKEALTTPMMPRAKRHLGTKKLVEGK